MIDPIKLLEAKRNLYSLLLQKPNDEFSESEIDIAYALSRDPDIQNLLTKRLSENKEAKPNG